MKEANPVKFNLHQHQEHQTGHLAPFKLAKLFDPEASWDKELYCLIAFCTGPLNLVLSFRLSTLSIGSARRCFALDSTSSGRCTRAAVGRHTFGWRHMVSNVSCAFQISEYSITLKVHMQANLALLMSFLAISTSVVYGYYAMILKVDEEEFGGHGALLQEGLFASITLFLSRKTLASEQYVVIDFQSPFHCRHSSMAI
ncbi:hypothetical protein SDJN03_02848, partial [Cucurbita argyrosperma subsp. sororia]